MKLVITIDTEEDNWGVYTRSGHTLENIGRIPGLQQIFDEFRVKPTYLVTYAVATDPTSVSILKKIFDEGKCDIGTHCHPWNTPPFSPVEEEQTEWNSMLCNLPSELQFNKIRSLHEAIRRHFGLEPICFRSGRWGYNGETARSLERLGYKIESSVLPYTDWTNESGPNFSEQTPKPYRFSPDGIFVESESGPLLQVPATVGYLQSNFKRSNQIFNLLLKEPTKRLRLLGLLDRLELLNKIWLSPENSSGKEMIKLARRMLKNQYPVINMFFHSPSLKAGLSPFVKTGDDERRFLRVIREFLAFVREEGIESIKLSQMIDNP